MTILSSDVAAGNTGLNCASLQGENDNTVIFSGAESTAETYQQIKIVSSAVEHSTFLEDYFVATFEWESTRYTVERRKSVWPFDCEVLQNDKIYFARWTSDKHDEFSIGALKREVLARQPWPESIRERHLENVLTYNVRHWSN